MIAIDVLNEIYAIWFYKFDQIFLHLLVIFGKLYGFLHNPASIAVLRELKNMILDDLEESMFMSILSVFKEFLEDIIPELILGQFYAFLDQRLENCIFSIRLSI